ncbi:DNA sulfur modification protein DndE [Desulfocurvibacter africanus]|uniref:DNA sulfur modification protein DndE n=1 Tax=Desulfocurvibacter africanus subsp. africanus str. Walvis Bay TaxID=690850 RepID=F3YZA1_DESAF|nr:DNA sulfur modification protein DndE [Desulfocurvibacter africanus]EGJ50857.1 DNA sulfur modification protein DndE [Desulfocurvibacter africanus subsp. africanus str. Walvis Bay]
MQGNEIIRLSQRAKEQLIWLKRQTGIMNWNVLCRWAFCLSLADPRPITDVDDAADSSVEMTWKTFGGNYHEVFWGLIKERVRKEGLKSIESYGKLVRQHIHRGISQMVAAGGVRSILHLIQIETK